MFQNEEKSMCRDISWLTAINVRMSFANGITMLFSGLYVSVSPVVSCLVENKRREENHRKEHDNT